MTALVWLALVAAGYVLGRVQPARRISDWANWQKHARPTGLRYAAVWTVLSAENISWLIAHPIRGARAWRHRNDPPPPKSPPVAVPHVNRDDQL